MSGGWRRRPTVSLDLVEPSLDRLPAYAEALRTGWSPSTTRDVSGEELAAIAADPAAALALIVRKDGGRRVPDGTQVPWLPGLVLWMWDGAFCGTINLRYQPGTEALPPEVSGHIGYSVVPWKRGRGYAKAALRQILPIAAERTGLLRVAVTCDVGNAASRALIEANGGVPGPNAETGKLLFHIALPRPGRTVPM